MKFFFSVNSPEISIYLQIWLIWIRIWTV